MYLAICQLSPVFTFPYWPSIVFFNWISSTIYCRQVSSWPVTWLWENWPTQVNQKMLVLRMYLDSQFFKIIYYWMDSLKWPVRFCQTEYVSPFHSSRIYQELVLRLKIILNLVYDHSLSGITAKQSPLETIALCLSRNALTLSWD